MKTVLITGCSSGFGLEIARYLVAGAQLPIFVQPDMFERRQLVCRLVGSGPDAASGGKRAGGF